MTHRYRFKVDKFIQDKLPDIIQASGIQVIERILEQGAYLQKLKDKLFEEAKALMQ